MASFRFFVYFSIILFFLQPSRSHKQICRAGCSRTVPIRFPFQMISSPPENRCGYLGFTVICKNETQNILTFPFSGYFRIDSIYYPSQSISITDPDNCIARRLLQGFNYSHTPFEPLYTRNFTFLNCTSDAPIFTNPTASPIPCLGSESHSVVALPSDRIGDFNKSSCFEMTTFLYPCLGPFDDSIDDSIALTWKEPDCRRCESIGGICQFKDDVSSDVACSEPLDLRFPSYERCAVLVVTTTGLCISVIMVFVRRKCKSQGQDQLSGAEISSSTNTHPQLENVVAKGLDSATIETYPTMVVGENLQLPKPTDNICPICLLEYKANDILRSIPSCMHYFHVDCIHEWLKRNATCPLCRN